MLTADTIRGLLPLLIGLPVLTAVLLPLLGRSAGAARQAALTAALAQLVLAALIIASAQPTLVARKAVNAFSTLAERNRVFIPEFVPGDPGVDERTKDGKMVRVDAHVTTWELGSFGGAAPRSKGFQFFIGLDGLNIWMIALTSLMLVPVVLISWESIRERAGAFYGWLFALQAGVMGVFLSFDIILFYVFFELTLIPLFFLISSWGTGSNRREAARKLFLFTLAGGLITLLGIGAVVAAVYQRTHELTFSIPRLAELMQQELHSPSEEAHRYWQGAQYAIFLTLAVGFAVKIPLVPLHSWLPGAYAEAPIGVTVMLSALLAKMGTFGILRICLPLAPDGTLTAGLPVLGTLGAIGIVYGSFCAYGQRDFKRLVGYSSVAHLGFCALALVAFNTEAMAGGLLHMVNHGLSTGALFLLVGMLLQRYSSGQIADFSGIWKKLPVLTFFMMVIALATIGLPGLNNFVSEMLMLSGLFDLRNSSASGMGLAVAAAFGILLSAWYTLTMIQRVFFNELKEPPAAGPGEVKDLTLREWFLIAPLTLLCVLLGCCPQYLLDTMKRDIDTLALVADDARDNHVPPKIAVPAKKEPTKKEPVKKNKAAKPKNIPKLPNKNAPEARPKVSKKEAPEELPMPREVK
jgi:NADH-quinone oxidoreductase subunit M